MADTENEFSEEPAAEPAEAPGPAAADATPEPFAADGVVEFDAAAAPAEPETAVMAPVAAPPGESTAAFKAQLAAADGTDASSDEVSSPTTADVSAFGGKHSKKKEGRRLGAKVAGVVAAVVVVALAGCCTALAVDDHKRTQFVPENTVLDGATDIGGMTADEVSAVAAEHIEDGIATGVTLAVGDEMYDISTSEMGVPDAEATAQAALDLYPDAFYKRWLERIDTAVLGHEPASHELITSYSVDHARLTERVRAIADATPAEAVNAGYAYDEATDSLKTVDAEQGIWIDVDGTVAAIEEAVSGADGSVQIVDADATVVEPERTEYGQGIFVNVRSCTVTLYQDGEVIRQYPCTPGMSGYGTPRGDWYLSYKDAAPTWVNPHSDWSKDMPDTIAPGPSNPLGLRALALSCGGGIYIHGTVNVGQLGYPGSHGCIRLANANIVELYDLVEVGIPIIVR